MKNFNGIILDSTTYGCEGNYEYEDRIIFIETFDDVITEKFEDYWREKSKIGAIEFNENGQSIGEFNGPFLIRKIRKSRNGNEIIL